MSDFHPSSPSTARARLREARRGVLLESAEQVFAERGYVGAKIAEIAARAGYSAGSVYNSFEGKEALFQAVIGWRSQEALAHLREILDETERLPAAALLDRFVELGFSFWAERPAFFRIYQDVTHGLDWNEGGFADAGASIREELEARFEARLRSAQRRGELAPGDPGLYTALVFATMNRAIARWMNGGDPPEAHLPMQAQLRALLGRALGVTS